MNTRVSKVFCQKETIPAFLGQKSANPGRFIPQGAGRNPALRDSVSLGNFVLGEFLDGDGGDDEEGYVHGSIRAMVYSYVLRQGIPMSCNHTLSARLCQPDCVSPTGK